MDFPQQINVRKDQGMFICFGKSIRVIDLRMVRTKNIGLSHFNDMPLRMGNTKSIG